MKHRALFLDRDGVINRKHDQGYVSRVIDWHWLPSRSAVSRAIVAAKQTGAFIFIVTNQSGVGLGLYAEAQMHELHNWMCAELALNNAIVDDLRCSLFHPDAIDERYRDKPHWRKPQPGMFLDLAEHYPIDMANSLMVGDKLSDEEAARAAGCQFVKRGTGTLLNDIQGWISNTE